MAVILEVCGGGDAVAAAAAAAASGEPPKNLVRAVRRWYSYHHAVMWSSLITIIVRAGRKRANDHITFTT